MRSRWFVPGITAAALLLAAMACVTVLSLVNPDDNVAPPAPVGPSMPAGYTVQWVPVGGRTYPCIQFRSSVSCNFNEPSPTPGSAS